MSATTPWQCWAIGAPPSLPTTAWSPWARRPPRPCTSRRWSNGPRRSCGAPCSSATSTSSPRRSTRTSPTSTPATCAPRPDVPPPFLEQKCVSQTHFGSKNDVGHALAQEPAARVVAAEGQDLGHGRRGELFDLAVDGDVPAAGRGGGADTLLQRRIAGAHGRQAQVAVALAQDAE